MNISAASNSTALAALAQYAQKLFAQSPPSIAAPAPGALTEAYQSESIGTDDAAYSLNLSKISASTTADDGSSQLLLTVGQALKAATPVDPGTGISEVNAGTLAGVTTALQGAFRFLQNTGAVDETITGGLSQSDINTAVAQAVTQFASGQNGGAFSISLSTVENSVYNSTQSETGTPGVSPSYTNHDVVVASSQSTFSITLSADGKLSSSFLSSGITAEQGIRTVSGSKDVDPTLDPIAWFPTSYDLSDPVSSGLQADEDLVGATGFDSQTRAISLSSQTVIQPAATQAQTAATIIDADEQGVVTATSGDGKNGASFSQSAALTTLTTVEEAIKDQKAGGLTAQLSITNTLAVSLKASNGKPVFLYARPDGTLGRFTSGNLNAVA